MSKKNFESVGDDIFSEGLTPKTQVEATKSNTKKAKSKKDTYKIVVTIDDDITEYFNNIMWIKRKNKTGYINELIKADFIKTIGASKTATDEEVQEKWQEYKKANRL